MERKLLLITHLLLALTFVTAEHDPDGGSKSGLNGGVNVYPLDGLSPSYHDRPENLFADEDLFKGVGDAAALDSIMMGIHDLKLTSIEMGEKLDKVTNKLAPSKNDTPNIISKGSEKIKRWFSSGLRVPLMRNSMASH